MLWDKSGLLQICISYLNHNREFVYKVRGFDSIWDMNRAIVDRWNEVVAPDDDVYVLGDLCLGGAGALQDNKHLIQSLKGNIHIVRGNHDTDARIEMYNECWNVVEIENAIYLKYKGYNFYMSHYPTMTANLEKESLKACTINLYAHTHQKSNFYNDIPYMYHVGVDSHDCRPVLLDDAIEEMKAKAKECFEQL